MARKSKGKLVTRILKAAYESEVPLDKKAFLDGLKIDASDRTVAESYYTSIVINNQIKYEAAINYLAYEELEGARKTSRWALLTAAVASFLAIVSIGFAGGFSAVGIRFADEDEKVASPPALDLAKLINVLTVDGVKIAAAMPELPATIVIPCNDPPHEVELSVVNTGNVSSNMQKIGWVEVKATGRKPAGCPLQSNQEGWWNMNTGAVIAKKLDPQ